MRNRDKALSTITLSTKLEPEPISPTIIQPTTNIYDRKISRVILVKKFKNLQLSSLSLYIHTPASLKKIM